MGKATDGGDDDDTPVIPEKVKIEQGNNTIHISGTATAFFETSEAGKYTLSGEGLSFVITDSEGNTVENGSELKENTAYTVTVTAASEGDYDILLTFEALLGSLDNPEKISSLPATLKPVIAEDRLSYYYEFVAAETGNVHIQGAKYGAASIKTDTGDVTLKDVICDNDISITNDTGKITVSSLECNGKVGLTVDTGKVFITNATCNDLSSVGSTGDINLINVVVSEKMSIERGTGDVLLESCDGGEILITTDTGDVKGSLLSDKIFITGTNTGRVNVPETTSGGKCKITTDTGNIIIEIE
jgi:hypothetical protein